MVGLHHRLARVEDRLWAAPAVRLLSFPTEEAADAWEAEALARGEDLSQVRIYVGIDVEQV